MTKDEVLKQALEALMEHEGNCELGKEGVDRHVKAITAIKAALAQPAPVQEPVAWQYVVQLLIAAGHVSQQKVDQACEIAKAQPAQST